MKNILLFVSLIGILLQTYDCEGTNHTVGEMLPDGTVVSAKVEKHILVKPLHFEGHKYIAFLYYSTPDKNGFSVVHAPDCPCMGYKENIEETHVSMNTQNKEEDSWYYDLD